MMKAIQAIGHGAIVSTEVAKPAVKAGYVLVKVYAAGLNPSDGTNASGGFAEFTTFPRTLGRDFAGVIEEDPWGTPSRVGKKVFGTSGDFLSFAVDGTHAEYCLVPQEGIAPMPSNLTFTQAACVGVPFTTAFTALVRAQLRSSDTILVVGASGAVGKATVQLAKAKGCTTITASRQNTTDINTTTDPQLTKALTMTDGRGPEVILDTVGDVVLMRQALEVLADKGRLAYIAAPPGSPEFTFAMRTLYRKEHSIVGCNTLKYSIEEMARIMTELAPMFEQGLLTMPPDEELTKLRFENTVEAYDQLRARKGNKYVLCWH